MCIIIILLLAIRMQVMIVCVWVQCLTFCFCFFLIVPSLFCLSVGRIILSFLICADCFMSPFNFTPYCKEISDSFWVLIVFIVIASIFAIVIMYESQYNFAMIWIIQGLFIRTRLFVSICPCMWYNFFF